jgi:hypothetical protein
MRELLRAPKRNLLVTVRFAGAAMPDDVFDRCVELVSADDLFEVAGDGLRQASSRPRVDTTTTHWVRERGTAGRDFLHRDLVKANAYRDRLRSEGSLASIARMAWVAAPQGDVTMHLWAGVLVAPDAGDRLHLSGSWGFVRGGWQEWGSGASEWMFRWFVSALELGPDVVEGAGTWVREADDLRLALPIGHGDETPVVRGYRTMMFLPASAVDRLGGAWAVVEQAPVSRVERLAGGGVATLLCHGPDELTDERLTAWRAYLRPVTRLPTADTAVKTDERPARPLDLLESDWPYR